MCFLYWKYPTFESVKNKFPTFIKNIWTLKGIFFKLLQLDSNPQPLRSQTNTQSFCGTVQMVELCCEYLSVQCILIVWSFYVTYPLQIESTLYNFVNLKELLARSRHEIWSLSSCNSTRTHNHYVKKEHSTI